MRKYEELKNELIEHGVESYIIFSEDEIEEITSGYRGRPSNLEVCGAYSVYKQFLYQEFGYDYKEVDMQLCGIYNNRVGTIENIPLWDDIESSGFVIVRGVVFAEVIDSENETEAYVLLCNAGI